MKYTETSGRERYDSLNDSRRLFNRYGYRRGRPGPGQQVDEGILITPAIDALDDPFRSEGRIRKRAGQGHHAAAGPQALCGALRKLEEH